MTDTYRELQRAVVRRLIIDSNEKEASVSQIPTRSHYTSDPALCLTSVVFPSPEIAHEISQAIVEPLRAIEPIHHFYLPLSMHLTIKNVRTAHDPPQFTAGDILCVDRLFGELIPQQRAFSISLEEVITFPTSISLIGNSDHPLQTVVQSLDAGLKRIGVPDNKRYASDSVFFGNITLCRLTRPPSRRFLQAVASLTHAIKRELVVDKIHLITCNSVCSPESLHVWGSYRLRADR